MTTSFTLAPVPKWYIADLVGKPLGGGYLATFSSLDHTSIKLVYQDEDGLEPWPYVTIPNVGSLGILFDENGSQGPFYFQFDTATPDDLYYLEVYDADGVLQWTIDDFSPANAGGGSIITTTTNINNQLINNVFWRNLLQNAPPLTPVAPGVFKVLAPGAHAGLSNNSANANGFYTGSDIVFLKSNNTATDTIAFPLFPLGVATLSTDVTPLCYFNYTCSNVGAGGETQKCVQFPIVRNVQNLSQQPVVISFWARSTGITSTILAQWFPFYGDGTASASVPVPIQTFNLSTSWQRFTVTTTVPSAVGKTLGLCNNDALFLQFQLPLSALCNIDFVKPTLYLGNVAPLVDFITNDFIDSQINSFRTGNVKPAYDLFTPFLQYGWIPMNDGTIGQTSSGASTYGGNDVFPLYNLLYENVTKPSGNTICVVTGYTGNAVTDFLALRVMNLPKTLGRAIVEAGTGAGISAIALGQAFGAEVTSVSIGVTHLPAHHHPSHNGHNFLTEGGGFGYGSGGQSIGQDQNITGDTGGSTPLPVNTIQPSTGMNYFIKL